MKEQIFVLATTFDINRLMTELKTTWRQAITDNKPLVVRLSNKDEQYTSAQRRLYFQWCTQFSNHFGHEQDDVHHDMKKRFLIAIYYRDDPGFAKMCDAVKQLETSEPIIWQTIREHVIKETSITKASKEQMSEYMDKFFKFAQSQGLIMRCHDDLKYLREMEGR